MQKDSLTDKKEPLFAEKKQVYIINFLMCLNGGIIAAYSYHYASMLATAITGGFVKIFHHIFDNQYSLSIAFFFSCVVFILGLLVTIFLKNKVKSEKKLVVTSLAIMIVCYAGQILLHDYTSISQNFVSGWLYYLLPIFFSSAIQYNTFGFMDGVQAATMFVTNNVRQTLVRLIGSRAKKDEKLKAQGFLYLSSLLCFTIGLLVGFPLCQRFDVYVLSLCGVICVASALIKVFE